MWWQYDSRYQPIDYRSHPVYSGNYPAPMAHGYSYNMAYGSSYAPSTNAQLKLNQEFRSLWEQHVEWTRMLIISIAEGLADEQLVTERLLQNPGDMAAVFRRYYGEAIASQFESLMRTHLLIAAELVKAAKAKNNQAVMKLEADWYANADEIARFLNSINPYWSETEMRNMLHEHLRLTKNEAVLRLSKNYKADIETYDSIEKQALDMADAFANGIIMQFPHAFR